MKNLNETKEGVIALNVVSNDNFLEINGMKIERKEYNGVPVVTSWDIAKIHGKENRRDQRLEPAKREDESVAGGNGEDRKRFRKRLYNETRRRAD